jgi:hypothetical protein
MLAPASPTPEPQIEYRAKSAEGKVRHLFSGPAGGSLMDAFDRFWQWADKPLDSGLTIIAELAPQDRRDRAKVNVSFGAARDRDGQS